MKRQSRLEFAEPERRFSADEVDLVTAASQCLAQLRGYDAAASDRRVTDDPDIHGRLLSAEGGSFWIRQSRKSADAIPARE